MKQQLADLLRDEGHDVIDCGDKVSSPKDGNRDFAIFLGCGVLCSIHFLARHGDEDDDLHVLYFGGRTMGVAIAWDAHRTSFAPSLKVPSQSEGR
jgi:ribose 5-phosphate isomerase RpiB